LRQDPPANVYCRTGMQAAMSYFGLRYLGYNVAL
jgi:3-mercaptopyruvate sulfurtransferase SseA